MEEVAGREVVRAASDEAMARGVRAGMALAEARALCPGLARGAHEPAKDLEALERLARWMSRRFSPVAATGRGMGGALDEAGRGRGAFDAERDLPAVFLDVTGCERLYGGLANLVEQVREALAALRLSARVAVAPTVGAAWAIASSSGHDGLVVDERALRAALAPLPPAALRIGRDAAAALAHLGVRTVGQLLELPRASLAPRFGEGLLRRIDQALGRIDEVLVGVADPGPVEARVEFDGPVSAPEPTWEAFGRMIAQVTAELRRRGQGARQVEATFRTARGETIARAIRLARPSRDDKRLLELVRCATEEVAAGAGRRGCGHLRHLGGAHHLGGARHPERSEGSPFVRKEILRCAQDDGDCAWDGGRGGRGRRRVEVEPDEGFVALGLRVLRAEALGHRQAGLEEGEALDAKAEIGSLSERLALKLGGAGVGRAVLVEAHLPEKAYAVVEEKDAETRRRGDAEKGCRGRSRPLRLLARPVEVRVMVTPSHDREGRPALITSGDGRSARVVHAVGPERIAGRWWEGHLKTRDYFAVEDEAGRRSWVFRVNENRRWFCHGEYG